jgi:GNAT superfamily N-acetyltransferase
MIFSIDSNPSAEEKSLIGKNLEAYNLSCVPQLVPEKWISCSLIARNEKDEIAGGILANLGYWGGLEIGVVWVREDCRKSGLGTKMLLEVEEKGRSNGGTIAITDTFDFNSLEFYLKNGYAIFGELKDFPKGHNRYYLRKSL